MWIQKWFSNMNYIMTAMTTLYVLNTKHVITVPLNKILFMCLNNISESLKHYLYSTKTNVHP